MAKSITLRALFAFWAVAPFLPRLLDGVPVLASLGGVLDAWFRFQCERDPARSFAGVAVCVRCLGIYTGFGLGGALAFPALSLRALRGWIAGAALAIVLDVLTEALGQRPAFAALRFATGFLLAYPIGLLVAAALGVPVQVPEESRKKA